MPVMNFDLEDGKPTVSFVLKQEDAERFVAFMAECSEYKRQVQEREVDARRYRWLTDDLAGDARAKRNEILERLPVMSYSAASDAIDAAMTKEPYNDLPDGCPGGGS